MEIRGLGYFEGNSAVLTPPIGVAAKFRETFSQHDAGGPGSILYRP
jgi:hypothetical protein